MSWLSWRRGGGAVMALAVLSCSTYRADLDRSAEHYNTNAYERAKALLIVLEPDIDSLTMAQQAQYAYYRGMTHFRLDERFDARHWLGLAAAWDQKASLALTTDEKKRVTDTLDDLNKDKFGGQEASAAAAAASSCATDLDCTQGKFCDAGVCKDSPAAPGAAPPPPAAPACSKDTDCPGDQVCRTGVCSAP